MSAKKTTSEIVPKIPVGSSDKIFYTITTYENSKPTNTEIKMSIDDDTYASYQSQGGIAAELSNKRDGKAYITVRNGGIDTIYADLDVKKTLAETGKTSLTNKLTKASSDALSLQFPEGSQGNDPSFWRPQLTGIDNIEKNPTDTISNTQLNLGILSNIEIKADRRTSYENLRYPEYISSNQDRIQFTMFHQTGRNISLNPASANPFNLGTRKITNIDGSVTLPIQSGIEDKNEVGYTSSELNPITGAMAAVSMDPVGAAKQLMDVLNMNVEDIQKALRSSAAQDVINALRVKMAEMAVGGTGLVPRTTGAILNPNLELLLNAPKLRTFQFNFKMSARSREEAIQIKKIIRFFKQGMSVKRSDKSLFVVSPNMFRIRYLTNISGVDVDHPSIGRVKNCALAALNTQYTPEGTYMTYDDPDRTMTSYNITMQFQELEPLTENDYLGTGPVAEGSEFRPAISINDIGY